MTEAKHVFTIEITSEEIELFTWGNCFYHTEDDKCLGCVGKKCLVHEFSGQLLRLFFRRSQFLVGMPIFSTIRAFII